MQIESTSGPAVKSKWSGNVCGGECCECCCISLPTQPSADHVELTRWQVVIITPLSTLFTLYIVYQCLGVELRCLSNRQVTLKSLEISTWPKRKHRITKWRRPCSVSTDRLTSHTDVCGLKQASCFRPQSPKGRLGTQLLVAYRIFRSHMRAGRPGKSNPAK